MAPRPGIVRADTIDLQDQDNPTAAEHQKHPQSNGLAPHQAAQIQQVREERYSEEQTLQDVWGSSWNRSVPSGRAPPVSGGI